MAKHSMTDIRIQIVKVWIKENYLLIGILGLSSFLNLFQIDKEGFGNTYYAAGVKSMLSSWQNFFYASFDPSGFVSLDKPPLGFWIQSASALVFGFCGWSLIFPQALSGITSTFIIYILVKKYSGKIAAVLAALFFCITPISVATDRNNTMDSIVVLTSLLAAWAMFKALENGKSQWLLLCFVFIGLGFNTKMSQAFLILPACLITYSFNKKSTIRTKIFDLLWSGIVLILVSSLWMTIVELTPKDKRPYVGGSQTNSAFELALNYNGISRWIGLPNLEATLENADPNQPVDGILPDEIGNQGLLRLFNKQLAGQISWLLPISFISLLLLLFSNIKTNYQNLEHQMIIFFGIWFITGFVFFTFAAFFHRHYLVMLSSPIAVLAGAGLEKVLSISERKGRYYWLFVTYMVVGLITTSIIMAPFFGSYGWIPQFFTVICFFAIAAILIFSFSRKWKTPISDYVKRGSVIGCIFCLLAPQIVWTMIPVLRGGNGGLPLAGPDVLTWNRQPIDVDIKDLIDTANKLYHGEKYYLGTLDYDPAEWIILKTGKSVLTIGGFYGTDPILSSEQLTQMVQKGEVGLFFFYEKTVHELRPDLYNYFHKKCKSIYPISSNSENYFQLYDCRLN